MQVWTYPDRKLRTLGEKRWEVTWWMRHPDAVGKTEIDPDTDIVAHFAAYRTKASAVRGARVVAADSEYGCAMVQEQRVDWFVEEDRVAEWADVGNPEEVAA